jgi:hypothetical protein
MQSISTYIYSDADIGAGMLEDNIPPRSYTFEEKNYYTYNYLNSVKLQAFSNQRKAIEFNAQEILNYLVKKYESCKSAQNQNEVYFYGANKSKLLFHVDIYNDSLSS